MLLFPPVFRRFAYEPKGYTFYRRVYDGDLQHGGCSKQDAQTRALERLPVLVAGLAISLAMRAGGLLNFAYLFFFAGLFFVLKNGWGNIFNGKAIGRYAVVIRWSGDRGLYWCLVVLAIRVAKALVKPLFCTFKVLRL